MKKKKRGIFNRVMKVISLKGNQTLDGGDNICRIICGFHSCNLRTKEATYFPTPMASIRSLGKWTVDHQICPQHTTIQAKQAVVSIPISRRAAAILISSLPFSVISLPKCSEARERRNKKAIPLEDYHTTCNFELSFQTPFQEIVGFNFQ